MRSSLRLASCFLLAAALAAAGSAGLPQARAARSVTFTVYSDSECSSSIDSQDGASGECVDDNSSLGTDVSAIVTCGSGGDDAEMVLYTGHGCGSAEAHQDILLGQCYTARPGVFAPEIRSFSLTGCGDDGDGDAGGGDGGDDDSGSGPSSTLFVAAGVGGAVLVCAIVAYCCCCRRTRVMVSGGYAPMAAAAASSSSSSSNTTVVNMPAPPAPAARGY